MKISALVKSLIIVLLFSCFFSILGAKSFAQTKTTPVNSTSIQQTNTPVSDTNSNVPNNLHTWTQNVMIEVMSSLICQITGTDPVNPKQSCLGANQKSGKIGFLPASQKGGAIGFMSNMITVLYTPPLHTSDYFRNLAQNFGITKKTYAQTTGAGFEGLRPLINIWAAFRNIVYLFLVLIFVIIGLAIMLRIKIDPRTVMTIQNQIPKVIIGILLVTFSYAISGFLIDMMYVSINIAGNAIVSTDPKLKDTGIVAQISSDTNPFAAAGHVGREGGNMALGLKDISWTPASAVGGFIAPLFNNTPGRLIISVIMGFVGKSAGNALGSIITGLTTAIGGIIGVFAGGAGVVPGVIVGAAVGQFLSAALGVGGAVAGAIAAPQIVGTFVSLIAFLVIAIAILVALFRLWFALIIAYIEILLGVVLAPFWIIGGIIPGSPISIGGWFRTMCANLLAFPATIAMFLLGKVFIDVFGVTQTQGEFVPPLIGAGVSTNAIGAVIGLGIILMTPNIVDLLKQSFKAPKTNMGIGAAFMAGSPTTMFNKAGQIGLSLSGIHTGVSMLPVIGKKFNKNNATA